MKPTAYEGKEPYVFISYAHKDNDSVMAILEQLELGGIRFWYDDGIAPGSEWPENIAQHLDGNGNLLIFMHQTDQFDQRPGNSAGNHLERNQCTD